MPLKWKAANMQIHEMMELAQQGTGAVNTLFKTLKALREFIRIPVKNSAILTQRIADADKAALDLQERIFKFQSAIFTLQDRNSKLEAETSKLHAENMNLKKQLGLTQEFDQLVDMCERRTIGPDTTIMVMNESFLKPGEPPMHLCLQCFNHKQKSELQFRRYEQHLNVIACHNCGAEYLKSTERKSTNQILFGKGT